MGGRAPPGSGLAGCWPCRLTRCSLSRYEARGLWSFIFGRPSGTGTAAMSYDEMSDGCVDCRGRGAGAGGGGRWGGRSPAGRNIEQGLLFAPRMAHISFVQTGARAVFMALLRCLDGRRTNARGRLSPRAGESWLAAAGVFLKILDRLCRGSSRPFFLARPACSRPPAVSRGRYGGLTAGGAPRIAFAEAPSRFGTVFYLVVPCSQR